MARDEAGDRDERMYEAIVRVVKELNDRELVRIDTSGPRITVTVDVYATEDGNRTHQERSVYAVQLEPEVDLLGEDDPEIGEEYLRWSYIGPVEEQESDEPTGEEDGDDGESDR